MAFKYLCYPLRMTVFLLALTVSSLAYSVTISDVYIFGDSISDTNAGLSDGSLWPVYFSSQLGLSYDSGNNYAVAGATTYDLASQVSFYQADGNTADADALYILWMGANDILGGGSGKTAAENVIGTINNLTSLGAQNFLVANMPDLGLVPGATSTTSGLFTNESIEFNSTIDVAFNPSSSVKIVDAFDLLNNWVADPEAFGLINATDSCLSVGADCSTYFFWDDIHPTTAGHNLIADEFVSAVTAVPIPSALWLFGSGIVGLIGVARHKKA